MRPEMQVTNGATVLFGDAAGMSLSLNGEGLRYIAEVAPLWVRCLLDKRDLDQAWRESRVFRRMRFGARGIPVLIAMGRWHLPGYRWATVLGAHARRLGLR